MKSYFSRFLHHTLSYSGLTRISRWNKIAIAAKKMPLIYIMSACKKHLMTPIKMLNIREYCTATLIVLHNKRACVILI